MKSVLLLPCVVLISVLTLVEVSIVNMRPVHLAPTVLAIPELAMPGHAAPIGEICPRSVSDKYGVYCHFGGNLWVFIIGNKISQTDLYFTDYKPYIGDLIVEWGTPIAVSFDSDGARSLYWPDRYAYVLTDDRYGPFSKVGFVTYGVQPYSFRVRWHGFGTQFNPTPTK